MSVPGTFWPPGCGAFLHMCLYPRGGSQVASAHLLLAYLYLSRLIPCWELHLQVYGRTPLPLTMTTRDADNSMIGVCSCGYQIDVPLGIRPSSASGISSSASAPRDNVDPPGDTRRPIQGLVWRPDLVRSTPPLGLQR
ncbi:hypothetical protein LIER_03013 [Lithospermum erythrorhizon]|uniref:Uncharacterized protein n=1 Tax=Lithospermum erythrorhizon TaxID=34254 RepID=A0AAV3NUC4_LITER